MTTNPTGSEAGIEKIISAEAQIGDGGEAVRLVVAESERHRLHLGSDPPC